MPAQKNSETNQENQSHSFTKKVLIAVAAVATTTILIFVIGYSFKVLLLLFAGILLGVILRSLRDYVKRFVGLPSGISLGLVILFLMTIFGGTGYFLGPRILQQGIMLNDQIPQQWNKVKQEIWQYEWGKEIVRENPKPKDMLENEENNTGEENDMTKSVVSFFSLTANAIASLFLVMVIAIYIAAEPQVYTKGFIRLFSLKRRARVAEILDQIVLTIQWWIVGQLTSMFILGLITTLGLWLLGVPYYLILGLLTALMTFIPNIGPIIAAIPTILVALTVGIDTAIYVTIFYLFVQNIEGYFITPMIHRKAIQVPPILIIAAQFLLYSLIGFIGVLIAMPLVACVVVIVQMVYIEDILGDPMDRDLEYDYTSKNIF